MIIRSIYVIITKLGQVSFSATIGACIHLAINKSMMCMCMMSMFSVYGMMWMKLCVSM